MERDGRQGAETGLLVGHVVGNGSRQVSRYHVELGVVGKAGAGHRDPLADGEYAFQPGAHGDHLTGRRITERQRLVEAGENRAQGRLDAVAAGLVENLAH